MSRPYGNSDFTPQAKNYDREDYQSMSQQQQMQVQQLKAAEGWINGYTPPAGFTLDDKGFATPSTSLVSRVQAHIRATSTFGGDGIPLPPVPLAPVPPIPPIINTNPHQAGASFGRRGSRQPPDNSSVGQVSAISINGRSYTGSVFDANGNRIA